MAASSLGRVSVICAPPNGSNPGMTSVDLAFARVAEATGARDVTYWRLWDVGEWAEFRGDSPLAESAVYQDPGTGISYRSLRGHLDEALSANRVVYWGDFMHMAVYQRHMADVLARRIGFCSREEADRIVARTLLLSEADGRTLGRVFSYGSTLSMNTPYDYAGQYGSDLNRFLHGVRGVWMRDPYSAQVVRTARGSEKGSAQGLDAAFLLHDGTHRGGKGLGVFIGRSRVQPEVVATLGRRLSARLHMPSTWIPWGGPPAFWPVDTRRRFRAAWPALELAQEQPSTIDLLGTSIRSLRGVPKADDGRLDAQDLIYGLSDFDVVLTDTYHLAINAWAQGTPTICLVDQSGTEWSVNSGEADMGRDKRVDLYSQLDALGLIVNLTRLGRRVSREVGRVADLLDRSDLIEVASKRIAEQRRQSMDSLVAALVQPLPGRRPSEDALRLAG
ncbi:hypothetical protein [Humibacter sp.]|uniref:hypothetical protein n=1 Tax=Humibacter sp. TaxID=1940291 RepID=UPI003F7F3693